MKPVQRCVCFDTTFKELKEISEKNKLKTSTEITECTGCGSSCGICLSYIKLMLETGETEFNVIEEGWDIE